MPILRDWQLTVDADMVLRGQGADPAAIRRQSPALVAYAEEAIAEGMPLVEPVVAYRELAVEGLRHERLLLTGGGRLTGPLIAEHLAGTERVTVMLCTVGPRLEAYAAEVLALDLLRGLALDGVGSAAAEVLATAACRRFEEQAASERLFPTRPLNPGMTGWPVAEGQAELFALVDGGKAGIALTGGFMMVPRKSLSLVLGLGRERSPAGRTCDCCHLRESCRYRQSCAPSGLSPVRRPAGATGLQTRPSRRGCRRLRKRTPASTEPWLPTPSVLHGAAPPCTPVV